VGGEKGRYKGERIKLIYGTTNFSALATEFGGSMTARYQHAICLVLDEAQICTHMGEDIASERFLIVSTPHAKRNEGFPIDSLSVDIESGMYYYDIDSTKKLAEGDDGFANFSGGFWHSVYGGKSNAKNYCR